ncbi:MAG: hypothetical protein F4Y13_06730 [Acidimicrobiaceae bacterium]|nr:hypothetical protein [Acidimicrobiaceae bacterium]
MLVSLTSTSPVATDLGFLLHKHPDRVRSVDVGFGCPCSQDWEA